MFHADNQRCESPERDHAKNKFAGRIIPFLALGLFLADNQEFEVSERNAGVEQAHELQQLGQLAAFALLFHAGVPAQVRCANTPPWFKDETPYATRFVSLD